MGRMYEVGGRGNLPSGALKLGAGEPPQDESPADPHLSGPKSHRNWLQTQDANPDPSKFRAIALKCLCTEFLAPVPVLCSPAFAFLQLQTEYQSLPLG